MRPKLHIQRASAGSGKTYALTKTFIRLLISKPTESGEKRRLRTDAELHDSLPHILAVTFTNKATAEMKQRIVERLADLKRGYVMNQGEKKDPDYLKELAEEFGVPTEVIQEKAGKALKILLLDYGNFQVSTIDSFFQSILRNFTYETDLNESFNLEIDSDYISTMSVDTVLDNLVVKERADEKKDAELLLKRLMGNKEDTNQWNVFQRKHNNKSLYDQLIEYVGKMSQENFKEIRDSLDKYFQGINIPFNDIIKIWEKEFEGEVERLLNERKKRAEALKKAYVAYSIESSKRESNTDKRIQKALNSNKNNIQTFSFSPKFEKDGSNKAGAALSVKNTTKAERTAYPELDQLFNDFAESSKALNDALNDKRYKTWMLYKRLLPFLGILQIVADEKNEYLRSTNTVEIGDTNSILQQIISEDETPFIYERMGTRINHYLIDEFQDTSKMQWQNLEPLLKESLANDNDNLIIGDAKQSIYRFRNADYTLISKIVPENFAHDDTADEIKGKTPEQLSDLINTNWRSALRIVEFNNYLFHFLTRMELEGTSKVGKEPDDCLLFSDTIRNIYSNSVQTPSKKAIEGNRGYVEVNLVKKVSKSDGEDEENVPGEGFKELGTKIKELHDRGYEYKDIAVLAIWNKDCNLAVEMLTRHNQENPADQIEFISDQSLLVSNAISVQMIIMCLEKIYRGDHKVLDKDGNEIKGKDDSRLEEAIGQLDLDGMLESLQSLSLITLTETIIRDLIPAEFKESETAYLAAFQDGIMDFMGKGSADIGSFLHWWNRKKDSLSIISPEDANAVRILTVHKAKGLEYPCVIMPDADYSFFPSSHGRSEWIWTEPKIESADKPLPPFIPLEAKKELAETGHADLWEKHIENVALDQLNSAYVALTRAAEELYLYIPFPKMRSSHSLSTLIRQLCEDFESNLSECETEKVKLIEEGIIKSDYKPERETEGEPKEGPKDESDEKDGKEEVRYTYGHKLTKEEIASIHSGEEEQSKLEDINIRDYPVSSYEGDWVVVDGDSLINKWNKKIGLENENLQKREEGIVKHSVMSNIETAEDLHAALLKHKIKGTITRDQMEKWESELRQAIESVRDYEWFTGKYRILNERSIMTGDSENSRPDRIMTSEDGDVIVVDYKFGDKTDVERYRVQVREYMEKLDSTDNFRSVRGYLWYVKPGIIEEVHPKNH